MSKRKYKYSKQCDTENELISHENKTEFLSFSKCGEIFMSTDNELLLSCIFCNLNFKVLDVFLEHLLEKHSFISKKVNLQLKGELLNNIGSLESLCNISEDIDQKDQNGSENKSFVDEKSFNLVLDDKKDFNFKIEKELTSPDNENTKQKKLNKEKQDDIPKGYWQCNICYKVLKKGQERKLHEKTHKGIIKLICENCGKGFASKNRLLDHIRLHTGEKPFKCKFCSKTFYSQSSMKSHEKTHIGFKPFKCDYCDHYFKKKYNKQIHERNQHNLNVSKNKIQQNSFICRLCTKSFKCNEYLAIHLKRHEKKVNSPKPFECSFCPSTFISNANKSAHERLLHKGEYNYKCDFCGKGFLKLNKKRRHEEMHTRVENPYKCDLCECEYARPENLKRHKEAKHSKECPYKCNICQAGFESVILFREHCKQHNDEEKQYGCKNCEARFDTQNILNRHITRMHNKLENSKISDIEQMKSILAGRNTENKSNAVNDEKNILDECNKNKINDVIL